MCVCVLLGRWSLDGVGWRSPTPDSSSLKLPPTPLCFPRRVFTDIPFCRQWIKPKFLACDVDPLPTTTIRRISVIPIPCTTTITTTSCKQMQATQATQALTSSPRNLCSSSLSPLSPFYTPHPFANQPTIGGYQGRVDQGVEEEAGKIGRRRGE
ncbi:hypothetical protein BT96DRAFT_267107 [Gymnopus androsaceus JB14]|uniref:Uncharacterized protein n=1 Tax=Gymnopus androsaceus JB14 TaxID=1447944 RepID=A0A6A4I324_9AGAR|nr:hypothetical protein BT96DRAFT_267107 [Gymnopus androsaceus JB14]